MIWKALRKLFAPRPATRVATPTRRLRPQLEALEDRLVPSTLVADGNLKTAPKGGFTSIQAAVNAAHPGDTITIPPGTYNEQVVIGPGKAGLTLQAQGGSHAGAVTIEAPAVLTGNDAIIDIQARDVAIKGLTIAGPQNNLLYGVYVHDAGSASILGNHITGIHDLAPDSAQTGFGIYADTKGSVEIRDNVIDDYQKGGILAKGGAQVRIEDNTITGVGPTSRLAQNGIQLSNADGGAVARARVRDNTITGNSYVPLSPDDPFEAAGILVFDQQAQGGSTCKPSSHQVKIQDNTLAHNDDGILLQDSSGIELAHNNSSHNVLDGILLQGTRNASGQASTFGNEIEANITNDDGRDGIDLFGVDRNTVEGNQANGNGEYGIGLFFANLNTVTGNQTRWNAQGGIALTNSTGNNVTGNEAERNGEYGIALYSSSGNTIAHNDADDNQLDGIGLVGSTCNWLRDNDLGHDRDR